MPLPTLVLLCILVSFSSTTETHSSPTLRLTRVLNKSIRSCGLGYTRSIHSQAKILLDHAITQHSTFSSVSVPHLVLLLDHITSFFTEKMATIMCQFPQLFCSSPIQIYLHLHSLVKVLFLLAFTI